MPVHMQMLKQLNTVQREFSVINQVEKSLQRMYIVESDIIQNKNFAQFAK